MLGNINICKAVVKAAAEKLDSNKMCPVALGKAIAALKNSQSECYNSWLISQLHYLALIPFKVAAHWPYLFGSSLRSFMTRSHAMPRKLLGGNTLKFPRVSEVLL